MNSRLEFVIGAEKRLAEIVSGPEMEPLLRSLVMAGPLYAVVLDEDALPICRRGTDDPLRKTRQIRHALLVEGEPKGTLLVAWAAEPATQNDSLALLARDALQLIINNNLKRMLTTELHTSVVQESYEQLVEGNRRLADSEKRYRELAVSLEQKVEERTAELQRAYARMLQQEKLAAVGSLAAGMAHEINNPNGFVRSNLTTFQRYVRKMKDMLHQYQVLVAENTPLQQLQQETGSKWRELKLDFVLADTAELLTQSIEGTDRIARIVADLKSFSHVDESAEADVDLNAEIERVLAVLAARMAGQVRIERELQQLPLFPCNPGLISQALLNIIQNALQSRQDALELKISSRVADNCVEISIADNGCGIAAENLSRVFDPFFTTRQVGSGTGMGLTVAREIIITAGGSVGIASIEGAGTIITLRLPLGKKEGYK